jgi:hypothetical protein
MFDGTIVVTHHILKKFIFKLFTTVFSFQFNPSRLFNSELKLTRSFAKIVVDVVGNLINSVVSVILLVDHNPLLMK